MSAGKYHINPDTGNANICRAHIYDCKFKLGEEQHYETKDEAKKGSEIDLKGEYLTENEAWSIIEDIEKSGSRVDSDGLSFDGVKYNYSYIKDGLENFDSLKRQKLLGDFVRAGKIAEILDKEHPTEKDFENAEKLFAHMKNHEYLARIRGNDAFSKPENRIYALAEGLIRARKLESIPEPPFAPTRPVVHGLNGLREAQLIAVRTANMYDSIGNSAISNFDKTMNRVMNGEKLEEIEGEDGAYRRPKHDRLMHFIEEDNQTYLATVWAERDLAKAMKKNGVNDVSVKSFYNTREWGNVYTVNKPNGDTMSFSVYEHRNSDSIIINGMTNWDGEELPYAGDSKNIFFAELPGEEKEKAADVLSFFMKESQNGEIKSDVELANSAMRIDWNAVLSDKIPGFRKWAEERGYGNTTEAKTDEDILKRLDFDS